MGMFSKIITAIRGGVSEVGEGIIDANAIRIMEQELRDAETNLKKAKQELTGVMAQRMQAERQIKRLKDDVSKHEDYAGAALGKGEEALALEIAEKIASLETELSEQQAVFEQFSQQSTRLKDLVKKTERTITEHKRQLSMVKTTDRVQKASKSINDSFVNSTSKLTGAKESLERIKKRQQDYEDRLSAAEELESEGSDANLEQKLKDAGIGDQSANANSVLARLKAKQG